jgi:hypothetical protein
MKVVVDTLNQYRRAITVIWEGTENGVDRSNLKKELMHAVTGVSKNKSWILLKVEGSAPPSIIGQIVLILAAFNCSMEMYDDGIGHFVRIP